MLLVFPRGFETPMVGRLSPADATRWTRCVRSGSRCPVALWLKTSLCLCVSVAVFRGSDCGV